jgi:menaquinone-dependent protoporphyrinogen IX oxidase
MFTFVNRVWDVLVNKPIFCFVLCIRVLETGGYEHALQNYMPVTVLNELDLRDCKIFPGKLDVDEIDWDERWTLVLHYDGRMYPNNIKADFRQWEAVEAWATQIHTQLTGV